MNRFTKSVFAIATLFILTATATKAQTTGSFDTTVAFMGGQRAISMYVPTNYNAANKYRLMICLHGLGDTCSNYRNTLINTLNWAGNMPNTILVCPEAVTKSSDFYTPAGGEAIIQQSISLAMGRYHIDTANVILQGFSLGGRAALRYGLDNHTTFKGLLLNTPAIQGVKEALNARSMYSFNYGNASRVPIFMTHGATDIAYTSSIDSAYEQLVINNGIVRMSRIAGLGHTIPQFSRMQDFLSFFDAPSKAGKDVEAVRCYPLNPSSCQSTASVTLLFRNTGQDSITSVKFRYGAGSATQSILWSGKLGPFQSATITASCSGLVVGDNTVNMIVDTLNATAADTVTSNNQQSTSVYHKSAPLSALHEGFEGSVFPPRGWTLERSGDFYTAWEDDNVVKKTGTKSVCALNTAIFFDNTGRAEGLVTPLVVLNASNTILSFDLSYNYHRYTQPYVVATTDFTDTLEVLVSTDCGAHYSSLFKKGGSALATFSNPILNPLSIPASYINPADSNWRSETIDLSSLTSGGQSVNALFKFNFISGMSGSINIDNVRVGGTTAVSKPAANASYSVYPNPVAHYLRIEHAEGASIVLSNALGQVVLSSTINEDAASVSVQSLPEGLYLLTICDKSNNRQTIRIMKQ